MKIEKGSKIKTEKDILRKGEMVREWKIEKGREQYSAERECQYPLERGEGKINIIEVVGNRGNTFKDTTNEEKVLEGKKERENKKKD